MCVMVALLNGQVIVALDDYVGWEDVDSRSTLSTPGRQHQNDSSLHLFYHKVMRSSTESRAITPAVFPDLCKCYTSATFRSWLAISGAL